MWRPQDALPPPLAFCTNGVCPWGTNCRACSLCIRNTQLIGRQTETESVSVWVKQTKWRRQYGIAHTTTQNHLKAITAAAADRQTVRGTGKQAKRAVSRRWACTMNQFTKRNKAAIATGIDKHRQARTKRRQLWKRECSVCNCISNCRTRTASAASSFFFSLFFAFLGPVTRVKWCDRRWDASPRPSPGASVATSSDDKSQSLPRSAHSSLDPRVTCNG